MASIVDPESDIKTPRPPQRFQRKRTKGWRMPEGAVYVGRPTKWGNDFPVGQPVEMSIGGAPSVFVVFDRQQAVNLYQNWQVTPALRVAAVAELAGRDLACWCPLDQPCHADVLLEMANGGDA